MIQNLNKFFVKNVKCISLIIIFILAIIMFFVYNNNKNYVIKLNNSKVYEKEFILYLYNQKQYFEYVGGKDIWETSFSNIPAEEVAKNNSISTLIFTKISSKQAKSLNINISEEENIKIKEDAVKLQKEISKAYPEYKVSIKDCKKYIKENMLEFKVFNYITQNYEINEQDFETEFKNLKTEYLQKNKKILLDYIKVVKDEGYNSKDIINSIFNELNINPQFNRYFNQKNVTVELNTILKENMFEPYIYDIIHKLNKGDISKIIETSQNFYIFKITDIQKYSEEEIKNIEREKYISLKKNEIYFSQIKAWSESIFIYKKEEVISNIKI